MQPPKEFQTENLLLRTPHKADAVALFMGYTQDEQTLKYTFSAPHKDVNVTQEYLETRASVWNSGCSYTWCVVPSSQNFAVGMVHLMPHSKQLHRAELDFVLSRKYWGLGIMKEAVTPIIQWAMEEAGFRRLWVVCHVDNKASMALLDKLGFNNEGLLKSYCVYSNLGDEPQDVYCFALT